MSHVESPLPFSRPWKKRMQSFSLFSSGPQYADVVMDESQLQERKVKIKEDCEANYEQENSEKKVLFAKTIRIS